MSTYSKCSILAMPKDELLVLDQGVKGIISHIFNLQIMHWDSVKYEIP